MPVPGLQLAALQRKQYLFDADQHWAGPLFLFFNIISGEAGRGYPPSFASTLGKKRPMRLS